VKKRSAVEVGSDGRLAGLYIVGFHGAVDPGSTPGLRQPVHSDFQGRLVRLYPDLEIETFAKIGDGPLPGVGTKISQSWLAYKDDVVVALGDAERAAAAEIVARAKSGPVREFLRRLRKQHAPADRTWRASREGALEVWCCSRDRADEVYRAIRAVAREHQKMAAMNKKLLIEASWWLFNAAVDYDDTLQAAAGLLAAHDGDWRGMLYGDRPEDEVRRRAAKLMGE